MKLILKLLALLIFAFCCSIIPAVLALAFWNSLWLWFYVPVVGWAVYMIISMRDIKIDE